MTGELTVGLENIGNVGISLDQVRLMLQEAGYFIAQVESEYRWSRFRPAGGSAALSIGRAAAELDDSVGLLARIVCLASQQSSAVASLLIYYQVIEIASDRLLASRLAKLSANPPAGTWAVKEALRDAVSERSRIVSICGQAGVDVDVAAFLRMRDCGVRVLNESGELVGANEDPGAVLYLVRNLVVHNQSSISVTAQSALNEFTEAVHQIVFAVIRRMNVAAVN